MQTDKDIIRGYIEKILHNRLEVLDLKGKSALKEECAFISGASAALQIIFGEDGTLTDYVPPMWMIGPMSGRSVLGKYDKVSNKTKG